jgi:hypothetical protein
MPRNRIPRDPTGAYQRQAVSARRVGANARCPCGEQRPQALIAGSKPINCIECKRKKENKTTMDRHHVAGKANSPITVPIPANDHKARLSEDQYDWPRETLENPERSPLRAAAGCVRGLVDLIPFLVETMLAWVADLLELLDDFLREKFGTQWWVGTPVENAEPMRWQK